MKQSTSQKALSEQHQRMLGALAEFRIIFKSIRHHYLLVQKRTGISGAQLWALAHIAETTGIRAGDLARALHIHASTVSNLLRALDQAKLIVRKRSQADQRTVRLFVTAAGRKVLEKAPKPLVGMLQQALMDLPALRLEQLQRDLRRLVKTMKVPAIGSRVEPLSDM